MNDFNIDTKQFAIIGTDIGHSKSPVMMNAAFRARHLNDYYYAMNIREEDFGTVMRAIPKMPFGGLTITIPYKIECMKYLDEIDPLAKIIGAVNTIKITDGKMRGFNTDGAGFVHGLEVDCGISVPDNTFFVAGAGGVAKAITTVLASKRPRRIWIANRTYEKATALADKLNTCFEPCCYPLQLNENAREYLDQSTVLINATNVGMRPLEDVSPVDPAWLRPDLLVADVIYNPQKTLLLTKAEQIGCRIVNGQSLLFHQGKIAFQIWTGLEAPGDVMKKAVFS